MSNEIKNLLDRQTKLLVEIVATTAQLSVKIEKLVDKLDYRKQVREERFIPPLKSAMPGIMSNVGED